MRKQASSQSPKTGRCGLGQYRDTRQPACRNQSSPDGGRLHENRHLFDFRILVRTEKTL